MMMKVRATAVLAAALCTTALEHHHEATSLHRAAGRRVRLSDLQRRRPKTTQQEQKRRQLPYGENAIQILTETWYDINSGLESNVETDCVKVKGGSGSRRLSKEYHGQVRTKSGQEGRVYRVLNGSGKGKGSIKGSYGTETLYCVEAGGYSVKGSDPWWGDEVEASPSGAIPGLPPYLFAPSAPTPTAPFPPVMPIDGAPAPTPPVQPAPVGPPVQPPTAPVAAPAAAPVAKPTGGNGSDTDDSLDPNPGPAGEESARKACQAVAEETLVTGAPSKNYNVQISLVVEPTAAVEQVLGIMRDQLQKEVAPRLTNCAGAAVRRLDKERRELYFNATDEGTIYSEDIVVTQLIAESRNETNNSSNTTAAADGEVSQAAVDDEDSILNVVFGEPQMQEFRECGPEDNAGENTLCVDANFPVNAYSWGDFDDFDLALWDAVARHEFNVTGLLNVTSIIVEEDTSGRAAVPEGAGNSEGGSGPDRVIEVPKGNVDPNDGRLTAGASVGIALGVLLFVLLALFAWRRSNSISRDREKALQHRVYTDDDDDEDDNAFYASTVKTTPSRKAHVLGENDSLIGDNATEAENIEVRPVTDIPLMEGGSLDDHWCASPNCERCEIIRQSGVQFIRTNSMQSARNSLNSSRIAMHGTRSMGSPTRSYRADDTVDL